MAPRRFARIVLHLLLAWFLAIPGIVAPALAVADGLRVASAVASMDAMAEAGVPCDELTAPIANPAPPCDCCDSHECSLSACLGTGCLPVLPQVAAQVPSPAMPAPWRQSPVAAGLIDPLLRPPIA